MSNRRKLCTKKPKLTADQRRALGRRGGWGFKPGQGWIHVTQKRETR